MRCFISSKNVDVDFENIPAIREFLMNLRLINDINE